MTQYPQLSNLSNYDGPKAAIETSKGTIKIALFPEQAPNTVKNFMELAKANYYDHCEFHRVIEDFMVQTGDPTGTGNGGESIWHQPFEDEFSDELYNLCGAVSMANAGPNTNGSQFFIVQNHQVNANVMDQMEAAGFDKPIIDAYRKVGGTPWLDFRHTVFAQVTEGMDVVDKIASVKVDGQDHPVEPVLIQKINLFD